MKQQFVLVHQEARKRAMSAITLAPDGFSVTVKPPGRSADQNAAQWPILDAFSKQMTWPVNGQMVTMTSDEWKDVLTAAFRKETARVAMGFDGGMVMLGARTSKFSKREFSEWIEFLHAAAVSRGVVVYERL